MRNQTESSTVDANPDSNESNTNITDITNQQGTMESKENESRIIIAEIKNNEDDNQTIKLENKSDEVSVCDKNEPKLDTIDDTTQQGIVGFEETAIENISGVESGEEDCNQTTILLKIETVLADEINVYDQLSRQIAKMVECFAKNNDGTTAMSFDIEEKTCCAEIAKIESDGSCLFGALVHQLHGFQLSSSMYKKAVVDLRSEVVDYIRANISTFEHELKGRIYDERSKKNLKGKLKDFPKHANAFLTNHLSKSFYWGGIETMKAVYLKYGVNVMLIEEENKIYYMFGFQSLFTRTLIIAYRLNMHPGSVRTGRARNHYDSVISIEKEVLGDIAHVLASNATAMNNEIIEL